MQNENIKGENKITIGQIRECVSGVLINYEDILKSVGVGFEMQIVSDGEKDIKINPTSWAVLSGGRYEMSGASYETLYNACGGNWYTADDLREGSRVCCVGCDQPFEPGQRIEIFGMDYLVVAKAQSDNVSPNMFQIPITSVPDETEINYFNAEFTRPLTQSEYNTITKEIGAVVGKDNIVFKERGVVDLETRRKYNSLMLVAILMGLISSFTVCMIIGFILSKRKNMTSVYMICGAGSLRVAGIYCAEFLSVSAVSILSAYFIYLKLIEPGLEDDFIWFEMIYKNSNTIYLALTYLAVIFAVIISFVFHSVRKTPKELLREAL